MPFGRPLAHRRVRDHGPIRAPHSPVRHLRPPAVGGDWDYGRANAGDWPSQFAGYRSPDLPHQSSTIARVRTRRGRRYVREPERRLVGSATSVFEVDPGLGEREGKTSIEVGSGIIGPVPCLDLGPGPTTVEGPEELVGRGSDRSHPARPSGVRVTDLPGPEVCCHYVERGRPGSRQLQAPATDRSLDPEPGSSTSSGRTSRSSGRSSVAPSPC